MRIFPDQYLRTPSEISRPISVRRIDHQCCQNLLCFSMFNVSACVSFRIVVYVYCFFGKGDARWCWKLSFYREVKRLCGWKMCLETWTESILSYLFLLTFSPAICPLLLLSSMEEFTPHLITLSFLIFVCLLPFCRQITISKWMKAFMLWSTIFPHQVSFGLGYLLGVVF